MQERDGAFNPCSVVAGFIKISTPPMQPTPSNIGCKLQSASKPVKQHGSRGFGSLEVQAVESLLPASFRSGTSGHFTLSADSMRSFGYDPCTGSFEVLLHEARYHLSMTFALWRKWVGSNADHNTDKLHE